MQCWIHVLRRFTEGKMNGADRKTLKTFYPAIKAIKNCRTEAQAKAVGKTVVQHMIDENCPVTAEQFERSYLTDPWFTWFIGCVGPSFSPTTNAQESWHKDTKNYPGMGGMHKASDDLIHTVFPLVLRKDSELRGGAVTVHPPEILPSEYLEEAKELESLPANQAYLIKDGYFYVKADWSTNSKRNKRVTPRWVALYEKGLQGDISPRTSMSTLTNHYLGLCKIKVPLGQDDGNEGRFACECDLYNLYLCCPHSIFVRMQVRDIDAETLTCRLGRVRGVGRPRTSRGALSQNDTEALRNTRHRSRR